MGFKNHIGKTVLLLVLALGVGIAVAVLSGGERTRAVQDGGLPVIDARTDQHLAEHGALKTLRASSGRSSQWRGS
jgi:hypothetical protein